MNIKKKSERMELILIDGGYSGSDFEGYVEKELGCRVEETKKKEGKGFQPAWKRWVVERTFGWLGKWRRLAKDNEERTEISEAMIQAVLLRIMTARLARGGAVKREKREKKKVA
jgi:putative transposase